MTVFSVEKAATLEQVPRSLDELALELAGEALHESMLGRTNTRDELVMRVRIIDELAEPNCGRGMPFTSLEEYDPEFALAVYHHAHERARRQLPGRTDPWNDPDPFQHYISKLFSSLSCVYWPMYYRSTVSSTWNIAIQDAWLKRGKQAERRVMDRVAATLAME